jgi:hypothetical protein
VWAENWLAAWVHKQLLKPDKPDKPRPLRMGEEKGEQAGFPPYAWRETACPACPWARSPRGRQLGSWPAPRTPLGRTARPAFPGPRGAARHDQPSVPRGPERTFQGHGRCSRPVGRSGGRLAPQNAPWAALGEGLKGLALEPLWDRNRASGTADEFRRSIGMETRLSSRSMAWGYFGHDRQPD